MDYTFYKKNRNGGVDSKTIYFKMLMCSPGKVKNGKYVFIRK